MFTVAAYAVGFGSLDLIDYAINCALQCLSYLFNVYL